MSNTRGSSPAMVVAEPFSTLGDMMDELVKVRTVVGTRYHIVLAALKLSKPTIAVGYSAKHEVLMADMGLEDFCNRPGRLISIASSTSSKSSRHVPPHSNARSQANADKVDLVHAQLPPSPSCSSRPGSHAVSSPRRSGTDEAGPTTLHTPYGAAYARYVPPAGRWR